MKKIISVILCAFMLLGVMSFATFAEEDPSVIDLTANVETAPVLDGTIGEGEYTYVHGGTLTEDILWTSFDEDGILIGVDTPYTAGYRSAKWALAIDEEYLYVALEAEKVGGAVPQAEFMLLKNKAEHPNDTYGFRNVIKADGTVKKESAAFYTFGEDDVATSVNDNVYVYEGRISRTELGAAKDQLHFISRIYSDDGEWGSFLLFGYDAKSMILNVTPVEGAVEPPAKEYTLMDLGEIGQQSFTIKGKTTEAPMIDGIVEENEYTLILKDMKPSEDGADDRFFCVDPQALDVENFNLYLAYDDDYIFIGAEVFEDEILTGESIGFRICLDKYNFERNIFIKFVHGGAPENDNAEAFATEFIDGGISYEIAIKRTAMTDYLGVEDNDDIKEFALQIVMSDDRDEANYPDLWPEMWFGCYAPATFEGLASNAEAAEVEKKVWGVIRGDRMPHVIELGDGIAEKPQETEPQETTPAETEPQETTPVETAPVETAPVETEPTAEKGCGASVAAAAIALVAMLGTCATFISKKR